MLVAGPESTSQLSADSFKVVFGSQKLISGYEDFLA